MSKSNEGSNKKQKKIYLDHASSVIPNPSSIHSLRVEMKKKLENARKIVAETLSARPEEIIFTSGGTESNNLAILGILNAIKEQSFLRSSEKIPKPFKNLAPPPHIITTNIEHASVLETCRYLEKTRQAQVSFVEIEANGIVDPKKIKKEIKENTILVSVMYANNEIGTIQPIREIAKEIRHWKKGKGIIFSGSPSLSRSKIIPFPLFHTDAVQAMNYLDMNVLKLGVDLLSISGSKIKGAGRVGVLYVKKNTSIQKIMYGGGQEGGLRPGTENVGAIVKFAEALVITEKIKDKEIKRLIKLRDYFFERLSSSNVLKSFRVIINGDLKNRLPNNVNITIPNIPSDLLVIELSARGIMVSSKSACHSGDGKFSHVVEAIHKMQGKIFQDHSLRFSLGRDTTKKNIDYTLKSLKAILTKLKKWYT